MNDPTVDAVIVMTGWREHVQIPKESILAGKYTAVEVGCAYSLDDCYELIEAYEKTKAPLMMLENGCCGRREMMALNMVKSCSRYRGYQCGADYAEGFRQCQVYLKGTTKRYLP